MRARAPRNAWARAMWMAMGDGQWHPLDKIVRAGMPHVPPNLALTSWRRIVVAKRDNTAMSPRLAKLIRATSTRQQVRDGAWHRCRSLLLVWHKRGLVEIDPPDYAKDKRVRIVTDD